MLKELGKPKNAVFKTFGCRNAYENTFFQPFESFSDFKSNTKSIIFKPLIDLALVLQELLRGLLNLTLGLTNMLIGIVTLDGKDLAKGWENLNTSGGALINAIYHTVSVVTDTLDSILRLMTHSVGTIGYGFGRLVGKEESNIDIRPNFQVSSY